MANRILAALLPCTLIALTGLGPMPAQDKVLVMAPWIWLYTGYEYPAQQAWVSGFEPHPGDKLTSFSAVSLDR